MSFIKSSVLAAAVGVLLCGGAQAQDDFDSFRELETKYLFGFTTGSDIGAEGEKEVSAETSVRYGARAGRLVAAEHRLEFETTLNQFVQLEFGLLGSTHSIQNAPGVDDIGKTTFRGGFAEVRYLVIEKTPNSRFGLTVSFEPALARVEDSTGERVRQFEFETKVQADYEFAPNRLWGAFNAIYEPEFIRDPGAPAWEREASIGVSAALAGRISQEVVVGGEVGYFRKYSNGVNLKTFEGEAVYVGPTLYVQLTRKAFLQAAFSTQIAGHAVSEPGRNLDLDHFGRYRAKMKVGFEF